MTTTATVAESRLASQQTAETAAVPAGVGSAVTSIVRRMAAARTRARTRRILSSLDDYALKDIGLSRSQIDSIEQDFHYAPHLRRM